VKLETSGTTPCAKTGGGIRRQKAKNNNAQIIFFIF